MLQGIIRVYCDAKMQFTVKGMVAMKHLIQQISIMGDVTDIEADGSSFMLQCRSGDSFKVKVRVNTDFKVVENLDGLERNRLPEPPDIDSCSDICKKIKKNIRVGQLLSVEGIYQQREAASSFDASVIHLLNSVPERLVFEETHWWLNQIRLLADEWLDDIFGTKRNYATDDFAELYRTNLNILGGETDDNIQECATLSRLIYGLSSAYLLTGSRRYYLAAKAGVEYQRQTFRSLTHDGTQCFWAHGWRKLKTSSKLVIPSQNADDLNSIPLYEQIYALAGLAQYYRITQEWEVLKDIERTINAFNDFYLDDEKAKDKGFPGNGGYFSHIDYATMRPDSEALGKNKLRKNWNSIGDHIPAYLVNILSALDPLPIGDNSGILVRIRDKCRDMLEMTLGLIVEKFPDASNPYVNERFMDDWNPDHNYSWQQNRAVVGHNLKIAWNLTRCAYYLMCREKECMEAGDKDKAGKYGTQAKCYIELAQNIGDKIATHGVDVIHGGLFDTVEREPANGMPLEFAWSNTKDFWQQEQAILAYLILHGTTDADGRYLKLAREMMAFWNVYFLDRDHRGIYFRVNDNGGPIIAGEYANKGSHAKAGYHAFELNYLAHIYLSSYVGNRPPGEKTFSMYFIPSINSSLLSINVLPDFFKPDDVEIVSITVNGIPRTNFDKDKFQIQLTKEDLGKTINVQFCPRCSK